MTKESPKSPGPEGEPFYIRYLPEGRKALWIYAARIAGKRLVPFVISAINAAAREAIRGAIARGKKVNPAVLQQLDGITKD